MNNKIKLFLYYITQLLLSILILGIILIITCQKSILSKEYMIKQLYKNDYYEKLYLSIQEEMSNYMIQSGLPDEVLENIYTKEMIEETMNQTIRNFYENKSLEIDTTIVKENLEDNITNYLKQHNIQIADQTSLDRFIDQIVSSYEEAFLFSNFMENYQGTIHIFSIVLIIFLWMALIASIIAIIFTRVYLKKNTLTVPLLTAGILILGGCYYLISKIDFNHLLILDETTSQFIRNIVLDFFRKLKQISVGMIIVSVLLSIINSMIVYKIKK